MALGAFRMEGLVDSEVLLLQSEDLMPLNVREGYTTRHQQAQIVLCPRPTLPYYN